MAQTTIANCSNSSSSSIYSENEDFLHNFDFKSIADLKQVHQEKTLIVVGTIKQLCVEGEWYCFTCIRCQQKVVRQILMHQDQSQDKEVFYCNISSCINKVISVVLSFKITIKVEDITGLASLTLYDSDVKKLIRKNAQELVHEFHKVGNNEIYPSALNILLEKKMAFKIQITYDNLNNKTEDEYVSKILFVIKPTTSDAKWIPFPTSEYTATNFALVVISSNPLHFKVIRLSYTKPSDMLTEKVDYDYYNIELFSSTMWQWREFQNIQLPSSVYPVSDEAVTSGGALYFLLSNDIILRFDIYSEEHILIFSPSTINELKPYASRLINFQGKLGYLSISGDTSWAIWIFIHNRWVKVDDSTYNESAHEWWNYRNNTLYFFRGNTIEYEVPSHHSQQVFSIRSDFDTVTMPGRYY
ncbi:unnamed protein product [Lactuca saligna]|uniref:Replication factor A C-terminal domain-containing protein n=1 Tax=Lactuca saligna TaxID=75948 RepID=A0AA35YF24_LACSI|nr:unnamed protein product [Lactuca saligna]